MDIQDIFEPNSDCWLDQALSYCETAAEHSLKNQNGKDMPDMLQHVNLWLPDATKVHQARHYVDRLALGLAVQDDARRIFDLGCGFASSLAYFRDSHEASYSGLSLSRIELESAKDWVQRNNFQNSIRLFCSDMHDALSYRPFPAQDLILTLEVLRCSWDYDAVLSGLARSLRPGGKWVWADFMLTESFTQQTLNHEHNQPELFSEGLLEKDILCLKHFKKAFFAWGLCTEENLLAKAAKHDLQMLEVRDLSQGIKDRLFDRLGNFNLNVFNSSPELKAYRSFYAQGLHALSYLLKRNILTYKYAVFVKV